MNKNFILIILLCFAKTSLFGQVNLLNADDPSEIGVKTVVQKYNDSEDYLEYPFVDEKDILFSKVVWEIIDLNQRLNFPLLYPTDTLLVGQERRPLIHYLIKGIRSGRINKIYDDGKFNFQKSTNRFESSLVDSIYTPDGQDKLDKYFSTANFLKAMGEENELLNMTDQEVENLVGDAFNSYQDKLKSLSLKYLVRGEDYRINYFSYDMVKRYMIKGVWYFDKRISELKYRPLAIAPITRNVKTMQKDNFARSEDDIALSELFWIYYPHARQVLKDAYIFNNKNSSIRKSFDEIINARRFHSVIVLEENVYSDRKIEDYMKESSFNRLLEAERIKEKIRNFEHDMWSW